MSLSVNEGELNDFAEQFELAQFGKGSRNFDPDEALLFAEYAFSRGFGVSKLEAFGTGASRGKHQLCHQMLGIDEDGENWIDHQSPDRALEVFKSKFQAALADGVTLKYKIWLSSVR